jgi:hypothetical protein
MGSVLGPTLKMAVDVLECKCGRVINMGHPGNAQRIEK